MPDEPTDTDMLDAVGPDQFTGRTRYWEAAEAWFGLELTPEQREIHETVAEHQYTLVEGANSFGKTFAIVLLALTFRARHYPSSVVVTSGTYGKLKRTFCADAEAQHADSDLFGEWKWSPNPHIDVDGDPTWQFEVHSPEDPEELEGVHNDWTLVIVDEADKEGVDETTIDAMESLISDDRDRMVVVSNPPRDETNVVYGLRDDYRHLTFSSFDSHNVQIELGERDGEPVPGLATLDKLKRDWRRYNGTEWPGIETARTAHEQENHGLDTRWLRRRAGVMPSDDATRHRPWYRDDVEAVLDRKPATGATDGQPIAIGADLARKGGDETVVWQLYPDTATWTAWSHTDHPTNEQRIRDILDAYDRPASIDIAVDASGEGSGVADALRDAYGAVRFKANERAVDGEDWDNKWTEALHHFGQHLPGLALDGVADRKVRDELFTASRVVEYERRELKSGDVLRATPKSAIKEALGRSPDRLDAAAMAAWVADVEPDGGPVRKKTIKRSGRDKRGSRTIVRR